MVAPTVPRRRRLLPVLLGILLVAGTAWLIHRGWAFYKLSLEERAALEHKAQRKALSSTGSLGLGYGFIAAALVVLNLSYLVRRRLARFRLGSMRVWLDIHVFTGMCAAVLATFHSAFILRTPIAKASAGSLALVVITGLVGRFLQLLAPPFDPLRLRGAYADLDIAMPGAGERAAAGIDALPAPVVPGDASIFRALAAMPAWRRCVRLRLEVLDHLFDGKLDKPTRRAVKALRRAAVTEARASGMAALLRSWRGLHRFAAFVMLLAVGFHAGVAWYYGYRWIFK